MDGHEDLLDGVHVGVEQGQDGRDALDEAAVLGQRPQCPRRTGRVEHIGDDGVEEGLLRGEDAEDRALGDPGRLGHLLRRESAPVGDEERARRGDDRPAPLLGGHGCCSAHRQREYE